MTIEANRQQVAAQCRAVMHLCKALSEVHEDLAKAHDGGYIDNLIDTHGKRSAAIMEDLGNLLNGMDAVTDADDWLKPIFKAAHEMFPQGRRALAASLNAAGA